MFEQVFKKNQRFALPPLPVQRRIVETVDATQAAANLLHQFYTRKVAKLDELKKSLLHEAFNGRL